MVLHVLDTFIEFEDYNEKELEEILLVMCTENDYTIEQNAMIAIREYLSKLILEKNENFANGRLIRNIYDNLIMMHARRVSSIENPTKEQLCTIIIDDFKI